MKKKFIFTTASIVLSSYCGTLSFAQEIQGQVEITYDALRSAHLNGAACREENKDYKDCQDFMAVCQETYGNMLGTKATIAYDVITDKNLQRAYYNYTSYNDEIITMSAMGLKDKYAFISPALPADYSEALGIKNIIFIIDKDFKNFTSNFIFTVDTKIQNQKYQCILSGRTELQ